jgi:hypothetical protein
MSKGDEMRRIQGTGRATRGLVVGASLLAGLLPASAALASTAHDATGATGSGGLSVALANSRSALERQLAGRQVQLQHLAADVAGAKSLSVADETMLNSRVTAEESSIAALVAKVPGDTTRAQLNADRAAMLKDNRVYAVMTPQVFITISADAAAAEGAALATEEGSLASEVNSLAGQVGAANAMRHLVDFENRLLHASSLMEATVTEVLAQSPAGYPGNTHVFSRANGKVLSVGLSLAHASYDASVIAMATGGYTGS